MNITVKNIPESVYRILKEEAAAQGRSLNAQIIQALALDAAEVERRRKLPSLIKKANRLAASLPPLSSSVSLIRQDRNR